MVQIHEPEPSFASHGWPLSCFDSGKQSQASLTSLGFHTTQYTTSSYFLQFTRVSVYTLDLLAVTILTHRRQVICRTSYVVGVITFLIQLEIPGLHITYDLYKVLI